MTAVYCRAGSVGALLAITVGAAIAICGFAQEAGSAPPGSNIVIKYGKNISEEEVQRLVKKFEAGFIKLKAEPGLDVDSCAAIVMNDIEMFRYSEDSTFGGKLMMTVQRLVGGKRMHRGLQSDCRPE